MTFRFFLFRGLWEGQTDAIIDVRFGSATCATSNKNPVISLIGWWVKGKKYRHDKHFREQCKLFSKFFVSVNGVLGKEAQVLLKSFS